MLALAGAGLAISAWAIVIHHRLLVDPSYLSPCDIDARFNCSEVYLSRYGSIAGVPVALGGVVWFGLVLVSIAHPAPRRRPDPRGTYVRLLSLVGVATVLYLGSISLFVLRSACVLCLATYVCVLGIALVSWRSRSMPLREAPAALAKDLHRTTAIAALLLLAGAAIYVALTFGRASALMTPTSASAAAPAPGGSSTAATPASTRSSGANDLRHAFEEAWSKQPRVNTGVPADGARVVILKFLDWECPTCKVTELAYRPIIVRLQQENPGAIKYVEKDFPLAPDCNFIAPRPLHPAPCEAAVAVRLATTRGKRDEMVQRIFANQLADAASIRALTQELLGVTDFDQEYAVLLPTIRQDVSDGAALHVDGTPAFFINGVDTGPTPLRPDYFQMAIEYELQRP